MISLVNDTIDNKDIDLLIDWLKTYPRLTKGPLTPKLEEKWSNWLGRKYSVFVNSGSSANLLMLYSLLEMGKITRSSKVVIPSVAWATDLTPAVQLGLEPILCDINLNDLSVDLEHLEYIFQNEQPDVLMLVSVLGLVPDMKAIVKLCNEHNVMLLEDTCESMGSEFEGKKLGTFGLMSSFSTYFGHHISTIEGGFISTDDEELYNILKSLRSHGWDRDLDPVEQKRLQDEWDVSEFNSLYTFYYHGFNLRSTDLQAFIGLNQVDKLDEICKKRNRNFNKYQNRIKNDYWKTEPINSCFTSNFAYPIIHPKRDEIVEVLRKNNVEVRPLICGSMGVQPFYIKKFGRLELPNASVIDRYGFYMPNNPSLTNEQIDFMCDLINQVINEEI